MAGFKDSVSKGFTAINLKTGNFVAVNKIHTYISTMESEIASLKASLGQTVYSKWSEDGTIPEDAIREISNRIREKETEIAAKREEIKAIEKETESILGKKEESAASIPEDVVFCSSCGTANAKNYKFCKKCGNPL